MIPSGRERFFRGISENFQLNGRERVLICTAPSAKASQALIERESTLGKQENEKLHEQIANFEKQFQEQAKSAQE